MLWKGSRPYAISGIRGPGMSCRGKKGGVERQARTMTGRTPEGVGSWPRTGRGRATPWRGARRAGPTRAHSMTVRLMSVSEYLPSGGASGRLHATHIMVSETDCFSLILLSLSIMTSALDL